MPEPHVPPKSPVKPGWFTSEAHITAAGMVIPLVIDALPPQAKAICVTVAAVAYTIGRVATKIAALLGRR